MIFPQRKTESSYYRTTNLHGIDLLCNELVNLIKQCSDCKKSPSMNVSMLSQTYRKKLGVIKDIIAKIGQINAKISGHSLLSNLRPRIKQQEGGKTNLICRNPGETTLVDCPADFVKQHRKQPKFIGEQILQVVQEFPSQK